MSSSNGFSSVGRALVSKTRCREFEPLNPCNSNGSSSVGRAPVSKTGCREFEPLLPCIKRVSKIHSYEFQTPSFLCDKAKETDVDYPFLKYRSRRLGNMFQAPGTYFPAGWNICPRRLEQYFGRTLLRLQQIIPLVFTDGPKSLDVPELNILFTS